jgi:hypothetical protein
VRCCDRACYNGSNAACDAGKVQDNGSGVWYGDDKHNNATPVIAADSVARAAAGADALSDVAGAAAHSTPAVGRCRLPLLWLLLPLKQIASDAVAATVPAAGCSMLQAVSSRAAATAAAAAATAVVAAATSAASLLLLLILLLFSSADDMICCC